MPGQSERGALTASVRRLLETLGTGATLDDVAAGLRLPVFRVRASLRDAEDAGLLHHEAGVFRLTARGADALRRSGATAPDIDGCA